MTDEIFVEFFEDVEVSNIGNVRRKLKSGDYRYIKGSISNRGYRYVQFQRERKRLNFSIHVVVAEKFIGERPEGLVVDHIDRNKLNNFVSNLRYISQKENCKNQERYIIEIEEDDKKTRKSKVDKKYHDEHRDKILARKREYYQENKERLLQQQKQHKEANREQYLERQRKASAKHRDKIKLKKTETG